MHLLQPIVETVDGEFACVECGDAPITCRDPADATRQAADD